MNSNSKFVAWIRETWLKHPWLILALVVFLSALFELLEFSSEPFFLNDPLHVTELILHGIVLPAILIILQRIETQKNVAINTLFLLESFGYQLNKSQSWDELIEVITQFPRNIVPLRAIYLWIRSPNSNIFDLELGRVFDANFHKAYNQSSFNSGILRCCQEELDEDLGIRLCNCALQMQNLENNVPHVRYCLPLSDTKSIIGVLHLYLPTSYKLSKDQRDFLESIVPEIALSINDAILKRKSVLQDAAIETERLRFASDLHDTLGQDLAYLRNKIDELILNRSFQKTLAVKKELHQMSIVADEANQTIRNILAATHYSNQETALDARLFAYSKTISKRAHFTISVESVGQAQILDTHMQFQIFLIFRELLANIEKHAHAHQVMITLIWSDDELVVEISDDGRGFMTDRIDKNGHFGLTIIEMRTQEMSGYMSIISAPNKGTKVSIRLPINYHKSVLPTESIIYEENPSG